MSLRTWTYAGRRGDEGAFAVLYALFVVLTFMVAALVVDISMMREDRRAERLAADGAVTAGAVLLSPLAGSVNARAACDEAWGFALANLPGAVASSSPCVAAGFPTSGSCPASTMTATKMAGPWRISVLWPIADGSPLLSAVDIRPGNVTQTLDSDIDGTDACGRMAVRVERERTFLLAGAAGFAGSGTSNTSVARSDSQGQEGQEVPLVLLEPNACRALVASGTGSTVRVVNAGTTPGRIALDSDATGGSGSEDCNTGGRKVAEANGGTRIQAYNGSSGEPGRIWHYAPAYASGRYADTSSLCSPGTDPSSVSSGICPRPEQRSERVGRAFVDNVYHCSATSACTVEGVTIPDHINQLRAGQATWNTTSGQVVITGAACTQGGFISYPPGDYVVDCPTYRAQGTVVFQGGRVTFRGGVEVKATGSGTGCLILNQPITTEAAAMPLCADSATLATLLPIDDATNMTIVVRGDLTRQNSHFIAPQTFVYQDDAACSDCQVNLGGGTSSKLIWTAPKDGPFDRLALWTETTAGVTNNKPHSIQASTSIGLTGTFFTPGGLVNFGGQPSFFAKNAQFIARRLEVSGGAVLELMPDPEHTILVPIAGVRLIR